MSVSRIDEICRELQGHPAVLHLLPMLYVGWADGVLSPGEIDLIRHKLVKHKWLTPADRLHVERYLDPTNPPDACHLQAWLCLIRSVAGSIGSTEQHSLVQLGARIAQLGGDKSYQPDSGTITALEEIEEVLGIIGHEASRALLRPTRRPAPDIGKATVATFDVTALTTLLDGDQAAMRDRIRILLRDPAFALANQDDRNSYRERVLEWCRLLAAQGIGSLSYPESCGGQDNMAGFIAAFETLAHHDLSLVIKFGVQFGLFGGSIAGLGSERHHRQYLPEIGTLKLPGCFAMTELGHGSNVRDLETTATYDHASEQFVIHTPGESAHKHYIGNAAVHGQLATVFAQLEINGERHGVHAFLVPLRDNTTGELLPGIRIDDCGRKLGLNGVDNGKIWFDQVGIPRANLLNRFADVAADGSYSSPINSIPARFFTMLGTLVGGRVSIAASALSAAKTGLTIAIRYANTRRQFGPDGAAETVLLDYRTHQRRLMPLLAHTYASHFAVRYLAKRYIERSEEDSREVEALAAGIKACTTWDASEALQACREACGGQGYISANRIGDLKSDSDIFTTFEGDNTVLLQLVARGRLTDFRKQFHGTRFFGMLRFLASQTASVLKEKNPLITRNSDPAHLRDATFLGELFRAREEDLLYTAAQRLKKRIDQGMDSYDAFIDCQDHLLTLARAWVERIRLNQFQQAIEECTDINLRQILEKLMQLHALHTIEKYRGWYLEEGYMEGNKAKAVRREVNHLCLETRQQASYLVDAFAIPESAVAAPIALTD